MKIITVGDLLTELKKYDKKLAVNIWNEDESYWISEIDNSIEGRIDINTREKNNGIS